MKHARHNRYYDGQLSFAITVAVMATIALIWLALGTAFAKDPNGRYAGQTPQMKEWFNGLTSGKGPCCSDADGSVVADADWEVRDQKYWVHIEGRWIEVPDDAVLKQPNMYGQTMVWPIRQMGAITVIRCFIPGQMT